jgi:hypothetical protein
MVAVCVDGFRPRIVQEVSDPYVVLSLVAAGVGGRGGGWCAQWPRWRISARGGYVTATVDGTSCS